MQNWNLIFGIFIIASPILFAMVAYPDSISWSWNEGRGGYLFALIFVVAELIGLKIVISKKRLLSVLPMAILTIAYLASLEYGLREYIIESAELFDVQLIYSWTWMWDFVVMAIFVVAALSIFFGKRWIRIAPAGPIFLTGTAIILSLDAFFPYDT
ncbi:MAG: thaumarchaeosortase, partial [Nitrosopumilus sp.]|nr:thaumarchaeosortase [Nitrosopumilus sp.]